VNIFGFYDDTPRDSGFQAALHQLDGTPRASAAAVQGAITETAAGCTSPVPAWVPAKRVIGAETPVWTIQARQVIRFAAPAGEGADVVACLLPGNLGGPAAAAMVGRRSALSPGCVGGKSLPLRPASFALRRSLPLRPVTVAVRLVAESSSRRVSTFSRTVR